jgi:hypothetical protein
VVLRLGCPEGSALVNTPNALKQHPLDVSSSNKNITRALLLAPAEPSLDWSGMAGRVVYDHTRPRHKGASTARRDGAKQWREEWYAAHSRDKEGGASSSSWQGIEVGRRWAGCWGQ